MDEEGASEVLTRCQKLPLPGKDGKLYPGGCADIETLNRLVQSIPSPKVEPWKQWLARVGYERIQETAQPSQAIEGAIAGFRKLGRDERWIEDRIKSVVGANEKTDQWKKRGVEGKLYAALNAEMSEAAGAHTVACGRGQVLADHLPGLASAAHACVRKRSVW